MFYNLGWKRAEFEEWASAIFGDLMKALESGANNLIFLNGLLGRGMKD